MPLVDKSQKKVPYWNVIPIIQSSKLILIDTVLIVMILHVFSNFLILFVISWILLYVHSFGNLMAKKYYFVEKEDN